MKRIIALASLFVVFALKPVLVSGQTTQFDYHGNLGFSVPNNCDFEVSLYDLPTPGTGNKLGSLPLFIDTPVTNGEFTLTKLNFGAGVFTGGELFLEIGYRDTTVGGAFTVLSPRAKITAVYANRSLSAATADSATNATQLGGHPASGFIQNTTSQQPGVSFNVGGDGTAGGTLSAATVNASTQYSIAGRRVLTVNGPYDDGTTILTASNTFAGDSTGLNNTPHPSLTRNEGKFNSFFGAGAGLANYDGFSNSFFGARAGFTNRLGSQNAFFGEEAGLKNSTGSGNSFFGTYAGFSNSIGNGNAFFGFSAGAANTTGERNSYFGVNTGGYSANSNSFFGYLAGIGNKGNANSFFGDSVGFVNSGDNNSFFGINAGRDNGPGSANSFFGITAGSLNIAGSNNTAFGSRTDFTAVNTIGNNNTMLGFASKVTTDLSNQTAIGALAQVTLSNSLVLGSINGVNGATADTNVGIGTTAPAAKLHISGPGAIRARVNSDSNAGLALTLNNQPKWSLATVTGGRFQIFNDAIGQNAVLIDPVTNNFGIGPGPDAPNAKLHVRVNSGNVLIGDAGCGGSFGGIGFGAAMSGCTNYSLLGEGVHTFINRPSGGSVFFREANNTQMSINPGGTVSINVLGSGGITQLCRNSSNQISTCSSSLRYKTNIAPFSGGLSLVKRLQPISFNWKANDEADLGLGAEDVAKIEPLLVTHNEKGEVEGVKYDRVEIVLINALKEQQSQIERYHLQLTAQQAQLNEQQAQIQSLRRLVCASQPDDDVCKIAKP